MILNELLCYCDDLQEVEVVICGESILGKAHMLAEYMCMDALYMSVQTFIADAVRLKVCVGCNE